MDCHFEGTALERAPMSESMRGLRVLITGATDGIGRLTADGLASARAKLVVHFRNRAKLDDTVAALAKAAGEVRGVLADLASLEETARLTSPFRAAR